jgi:hypothetical protein
MGILTSGLAAIGVASGKASKLSIGGISRWGSFEVEVK